jgi:hypothetical protein
MIKPWNPRWMEHVACMHEGKRPLESLDTYARMVLNRIVGCEDDEFICLRKELQGTDYSSELPHLVTGTILLKLMSVGIPLAFQRELCCRNILLHLTMTSCVMLGFKEPYSLLMTRECLKQACPPHLQLSALPLGGGRNNL